MNLLARHIFVTAPYFLAYFRNYIFLGKSCILEQAYTLVSLVIAAEKPNSELLG